MSAPCGEFEVLDGFVGLSEPRRICRGAGRKHRCQQAHLAGDLEDLRPLAGVEGHVIGKLGVGDISSGSIKQQPFGASGQSQVVHGANFFSTGPEAAFERDDLAPVHVEAVVESLRRKPHMLAFAFFACHLQRRLDNQLVARHD